MSPAASACRAGREPSAFSKHSTGGPRRGQRGRPQAAQCGRHNVGLKQVRPGAVRAVAFKSSLPLFEEDSIRPPGDKTCPAGVCAMERSRRANSHGKSHLTITFRQYPPNPARTILEPRARPVSTSRPCATIDLMPDGNCRVVLRRSQGTSGRCARVLLSGQRRDGSHDAHAKGPRGTADDRGAYARHHPQECLTCARSECELQALAKGAWHPGRPLQGQRKLYEPTSAVGSGFCAIPKSASCAADAFVRAIKSRASRHCIRPVEAGTRSSPAGRGDLADAGCVNCGQCINRCPDRRAQGQRSRARHLGRDSRPHQARHRPDRARRSRKHREEFGWSRAAPRDQEDGHGASHAGLDKVFDTDFTADSPSWRRAASLSSA